MEQRTFFKNQREMACSLNLIIDAYWNEDLSEPEMMELVNKIYTNNREKMIKKGRFTKIVIQQCWKKRTNLITKIIACKWKDSSDV